VEVSSLLAPAASAFVEVGAFVAMLLALFARLQLRSGPALSAWLVRQRRFGPLVGAGLGVLPGCAGAIVVMPIYVRGTVSFGTVVATLVATMGDASFVLLATQPTTALGVHVTLLLTGVAAGFVVDTLGIAPARAATLRRVATEPLPVARSSADRAAGSAGTVVPSTPRQLDRGAGPGRTVQGVLLLGAARLFWGLVAAGSVLLVVRLVGTSAAPGGGVPLDAPGPSWGHSLEVLVGVTGLLTCVALLVLGRGRGTAFGCTATARSGEVLLVAARETAIVVCWVAVAFVVIDVVVAATGVDLARLPVLGLLGVLAGAALGLVPGCGPQLVLTGLYVQGLIPLPMLLANALSQDGDALLPLLILDRRAALLGTALSTIPAVLVGSVLVGLGW
jgi:hypothetical protein